MLVGSCSTGPAPQIRPLGSAGDRKAVKTMSPMPLVRSSPGNIAGCEITGRMVRVMMFQSGLT